MNFGYACVSHDPQLPSPLWAYPPERLHALLAVRQNLVGLDKVPSVTLEDDARWLLLHPNCDVELVNVAGERVTLDEAIAQAQAEPAPLPALEAQVADDAAPEATTTDEDDEGEVGDEPPPAPIETATRPTRRPRSMPAGELVDGVEKWRCEECGGFMDEQEAVLSWSRRVLLCRKDINARRVG